MRATATREPRSLVRSLYLAAALVAVIAYAVVIAPAERRVSTMQEHARLLYDEANVDESKVSQSVELDRIKERIQRDLHRLAQSGSDGAETAAALRLLGAEGKKFSVEVRSIAPLTAAPPAPGKPERYPLAGTRWSFVVRARFRDIVGLLGDISRHDVLVDVRDVDLTVASRDASPLLDATVQATLYRPPTQGE